MLALADQFGREIASGTVNASDLARRNGITRARVSQILALHRLAPVILRFLQDLTPSPHARVFTERRLRPLLGMPHRRQMRAARELLPGFKTVTPSV